MTLTSPNKKYLLLPIFLFFAMMAINHFGMLLNITPSMKLGIYLRANSEIQRSSIIALCLPEPYKTIGLKNFYIQKGRKCSGSDPLIKQVIAVPGDHVVLTKDHIQVNEWVYFYKTLSKDSQGSSLSVYPRGDYLNTKGYWVIGTHASNSWDSRYWGPIKKENLLYKLQPLVVV